MHSFRLTPTSDQESILLRHCAHARFVWNLCVEQESHWHRGRRPAPGYLEKCRQLTAARAEHAWLREGSQLVQQQAIRDHAQAMNGYFMRTHGRPTWRKAGRNEGFRIVAVGTNDVRRLNRNTGAVRMPKVGWVRFRWSRVLPSGVKSYRVSRDPAGRWHVAFATVPDPVPAPGNGRVVGVDRGVKVSAALSTGELLHVPGLQPTQQRRLVLLQRRLARCQRGSNRRRRVKNAIAKLKARDADRRKDWAHKVSTDLARRFDVIRIEDLNIRAMTRSGKGTADAPGRKVRAKAGLNRSILHSGWGLLVYDLDYKASGRIERVITAYTSQRCSACGHVDAKSRESQAVFACTACGYTLNADVNAAKNIAAGHAVTARGGDGITRPGNREPQRLSC